MTTTYDWRTIYQQAVETFGSAPGAQLEEELLAEFQHSPHTIAGIIDEAASGYTAGRIRSPWGIVRSELARIASQPHVTVEDTRSKEAAVARAEQWVRSAGMHFDRESEILDELFGDRGRLRAYRTDLALTARMVDLWKGVRPVGEQIEAEALERAERWKAVRKKMEKVGKAVEPQP